MLFFVVSNSARLTCRSNSSNISILYRRFCLSFFWLELLCIKIELLFDLFD
nr:MAG TPA: hypothetical protein [Bacteriophage sp.]